MKKIVFIIFLCLGCLCGLSAQNIWKPIGMNGEFLGVSANGDLFCGMGYSGVYRSHDEGATWESIYTPSYVRKETFMINEQERIFVFNENSHKLCYSDDNGDTWLEQTSGISSNWPLGMFSLSNDTLFIASQDKFFWTLDGGESWNETPIDFIDEALFGSILADHSGNIYVSTYSWTIPVEHTGIYTATMDDLTQWTVKTQGGARDMAFDSQGNILAASPTFLYDNGVYFVNADRFAVTDDDVIFAMKRLDNYSESLFYSTDHGETYTQYGESIPQSHGAPDPDLGLFKGRDNHLYCHGFVWDRDEWTYYKSMRMVDDIVNPHIQYQQGWQELQTGVSEDLYGVYCISQTQVVACGQNGKILKTSDGGLSWDVVYEKLGYDMIHVAFSTSEVGYACGDSCAWDETNHKGIMVKTTDGGATWNELPNTEFVSLDQPSWAQNNKFVVDGNQLYLFDDNGILWSSNDSGQTFTSHQFDFGRVDYCEMYMEHCYDHIGGCLLVADVDAQFQRRLHVFITTNGGTSWTEKLTLDCEAGHQFVAQFAAYYLVELYGYYNNGENNLLITSNGFDTYFYTNTESDILDEYAGDVARAKFSDPSSCVLFGRNLDKGSIEWAPILFEIDWLQGECKMNHLGIPYCYNDGMTHCRDLNCIDGLGATFFIASEEGIVYKSGLVPVVETFPRGTEWYYEIKHINGDITYQHLEYTADTAVNSKRVKIITETNTMYDKSTWTDQEFIYEDGDRIYWWNKDLEDFTLLYDFGADVGDEWEINGGWFTITVHVDEAHTVTYKSETYRVLSVTDAAYGLFTGDIICGIGHQKSFFPGTPMAKDYEVDGLRCFWQEGELVLNMNGEDCDAIYTEIHNVDENAVQEYTVFPNPSKGLITISNSSLLTPNSSFVITNLLGQTVQTGPITTDNQEINVHNLPEGMYFLTIGNQTQKIIINRP